MTDNEIVCTMLAYSKTNILLVNGEPISIGDILDLINRQKADIERLKAELKEDSRVMKQALALVDEIKKEIAVDIETAKVEAVKEFAERVKSRLITVTYINFDDIIDNLVKEMVGAESG